MAYKNMELKRATSAARRGRRRGEWLSEHGPCSSCGASEGLEIHRRDLSAKDSNMWEWAEDRLAAALAECVVLCRPCYTAQRALEYGEPPMQRFLSFVSVCQCAGSCSCCHIWTGGRTSDGYPRFRTGSPSRTVLAHRWVYQQEVGSIPKGHHVDHLCFNPTCVRVDHLEPVTPQENLRRRRR